jgi:hypothetical protein
MNLNLVIPETEYIDIKQQLLPWYTFSLTSNITDDIPAHKRRSFVWSYYMKLYIDEDLEAPCMFIS